MALRVKLLQSAEFLFQTSPNKAKQIIKFLSIWSVAFAKAFKNISLHYWGISLPTINQRKNPILVHCDLLCQPTKRELHPIMNPSLNFTMMSKCMYDNDNAPNEI